VTVSPGEQRIDFTADGEYELTVTNRQSKPYVVAVEIDREAPVFAVSLEKGVGYITYESADIGKVVVNRDGEEQEYGEIYELTVAGNYKIAVYDKAGNAAVASLTVPEKVNIAGILAVVIFIGILIVGVVFIRNLKGNLNVK
jgi:hypothetical protein